mgnify:CR=1 FL=1
MYCEYCGNKIEGAYKFCTKCGQPTSTDLTVKTSSNTNPSLDQKWWHRLSKVLYIAMYIPLPFALIAAWDDLSYYSESDAFWYSVLIFIVWIIVLRVIRITYLYIALAQKPQWKKEFRRFF